MGKERIKMKKFKRTVAAILLVCVSAVQVTAAGTASKDETVYVNLNTDGSLKGAYVVNSFKISGADTVTDYGNYKKIKNLSTTENPEISGGYIKWNVPENAEDFYYQGDLDRAELPWDFKITYTLNGKKVSAKKLAGKKGKVGITIDATVNEKANEYFKNNYLVQLSISFDTEKCKNIACEDAMTANVGSTKSLTLMVLPNMDKTFNITLDANNFEMDGMTIAMVKVSDGILGNIDSLKVGMSQISSSVSSLVSGTGELAGGAEDLASGLNLLNTAAQSIVTTAPALTSGMDSYKYGIDSLDSGLAEISGGSGAIRSGLAELDSKSYDVIQGISRISGGLKEMTGKKTEVKQGLKELEKNKSAINELKTGGQTLRNGYKQIETGLNTLSGNADKIVSGAALLQGQSTDISKLKGGAASIKAGAGNLSGAASAEADIINSLLNAAKTDPNLAKYAAQLGGLQQYNSAISGGLGEISAGADALSTGIDTAQTGLNTLFGAASTFSSAAVQMAEGAKTMYTNMQTLNNGFDTFYNGAQKASDLFGAANTFGNAALQMTEGAEKLLSGTNDLQSGFEEYAGGVGTIYSNYSTIDNAIYTAKDGSSQLSSGFDELHTGTEGMMSVLDEFSDSIDTLTKGGNQLFGGSSKLASVTGSAGTLLSSYGGDITSLIAMSENAEVVSFAAPGKVKPKSVQFVIKTPSIKAAEKEITHKTEEKLNFWQKLVRLFTGK